MFWLLNDPVPKPAPFMVLQEQLWRLRSLWPEENKYFQLGLIPVNVMLKIRRGGKKQTRKRRTKNIRKLLFFSCAWKSYPAASGSYQDASTEQQRIRNTAHFWKDDWMIVVSIAGKWENVGCNLQAICSLMNVIQAINRWNGIAYN